jgi:hypothetical protein
MDWLWVIQLVLNIFLLNSIFAWWKERKDSSFADLQSAVRADMEALETQARQIEKDAALVRRQTEDQLQVLNNICQQAQAILLRHSTDGVVLTPSLEEQELKALRDPLIELPRAGTIPSVQELQARKQAIRPEIPLDLRSLLRDQLT